MTPPRDGIITANGLTAEFRFIQALGDLTCVETATGEAWVHDSLLTYDSVRDLSPEAAAVVAEPDKAL